MSVRRTDRGEHAQDRALSDEESGDSDDEPTAEAPEDHALRHRLVAADAAKAALRQLFELTGKKPTGVTSVEPAEGGWVVGVEVLEDQRIPSSADILALYEVEVDDEGSLVSYRRLRRYPRGRGDRAAE